MLMVKIKEITTRELENIIEMTIYRFIKRNKSIIERKLSERTLCGAFMYDLYETISKTRLKDYYVDIEFNRHQVRTKNVVTNDKKRIVYEEKVINIFTDIIVHGRNELNNSLPDNLIAIEMKKKIRDSEKYNEEYKLLKFKDIDRLRRLTNSQMDLCNSSNDIIYNYQLGVYLEIDYKKRAINYFSYVDGENYGDVKCVSFS